MSEPRPRQTLDRLPVGTMASIHSVAGVHAAELAREGLTAGAYVRVRSHAPWGGPVIVEVAGAGVAATVALSRAIAAYVTVASVDPDVAT